MKLLTTLSTCFAILIFGGCAESDPDTDVVESVPLTVPLTDIVNDVEAHGINSKYKGQKVTITTAGRIAGQFTALTLNPAIELFTHNDKVRFFIEDSEFDAALDMGNYYFAYMKSDLAPIRPHTTYTFILSIQDISENTTARGTRFFTIWADVPEHIEQADIEVVNTTLEAVVADVSAGNGNYVGKTVRLQATVSLDILHEVEGYPADMGDTDADLELLMLKDGRLTLSTHNRNVVFWVIDDMGPFGAINLQKYHNNQVYTFTLYIESIRKKEGRFEITAGIADD